jgi:diadenosine tetraphosphatase ApaH/serine/threonine PP2A family protein phosphatase
MTAPGGWGIAAGSQPLPGVATRGYNTSAPSMPSAFGTMKLKGAGQLYGTTTLPGPVQTQTTACKGGILVDTQEDLVEPAVHAKRVTGFNRRAMHGINIMNAMSGNEHGSDVTSAMRFEGNPQASQIANTVVQQAMAMAQVASQEVVDCFDHDWRGPNGQDPLYVLYNNSNMMAIADAFDYLASEVTQVLASQPTLVEADIPTKVFGDLHGQLRDMLLLLFHYGFPETQGPSFVFNGDWVDRGRHQVEVVSLIFALKVLYPTRVWILRGNHEDAIQNHDMGPVGFEHAILQRFGGRGHTSLAAVSQAFNYLPLGCVVAKRILIVHGGIGSGQWTLQDLAARQRPIDHDAIQTDPVTYNVLWSDPIPDDPGRQEDIFGVHDSPRDGHAQRIFTFGKDVTDRFCATNGIEMIVRSHQALARGFGYDVMHGGRCVRVFSARDYEGHGNDGAILSITQGNDHLLARAQVIRSLACPKADATPLVASGNAMNLPNPFFM